MEGGFTESREIYIAFWGKRAFRGFCKAFLSVLVLGKVPLGCFSPIPRLPFSSLLCLTVSPPSPTPPQPSPGHPPHRTLCLHTEGTVYFHSLSRLIGSVRKAKMEVRLILVISFYNKQMNKKTHRLFVEKSVLSLPPEHHVLQDICASSLLDPRVL